MLYLSFPHFLAEKSIDVLPPACAHNSAPRPRAFARGSCIFFPAEKSAPLRAGVADYLLPNICANHHGITVPFLSTDPRNEQGNFQKCMGIAGKVQHPQYAHLQGCNSMFYKSLSCGKKVQFFATKSAIFFNPLFFMFLFFRSCGKKKCNLIALLLHFYCTLRVLNFSFCFIVLCVFFRPCCTCCTFPTTPHDF